MSVRPVLRIAQEALTFDDVLLLPAHSRVLPFEVSLKTRLTSDIALNIPLISAAMDTVTESRLAIALAQSGGIGVIHRNMPIRRQAAEVYAVKKYESGVIRDPITIGPNSTIRDLRVLKQRHNISGVPVVENGIVIGIVTNRDVRFETNLNTPITAVMTPKDKLVTVGEGANNKVVQKLLQQHRIEKVLVVDDNFLLTGMITVKDIDRASRFPDAAKDKEGRLRVGAAVGTDKQAQTRVEALVEAGVDVLIVDTAHGHSQKVIDVAAWIVKTYPDLSVVAGNIATATAAKALIDVGVTALKVGIGPGSICTTRIVTGIGVPQITAIADVAEVASPHNITVIADGGIRYSGDIAKAIVAGADAVMVGSLLAGTEEAPGEVELYQGRAYKSYRAMGSLAAMAQPQSSADRYFQDPAAAVDKLVPEGIEGRVPYKGPIDAIVHQLMGGLRASMGYTGSPDIATMQSRPEFIRITQASMIESHVHDVTITKEAPNYPVS